MSEGKVQPNRRERRRQEVHDRIIEAAVELFDRRGVQETRIDDICEHADLAQKTFFNHFPTKQHLFREIAEAFIGIVCHLVAEARTKPGTTAERLTDAFRRIADVAQHRGPRHRELVQEVVRISATESISAGPDSSLRQAFQALVDEGVAAGDVTRSQDPLFLTEMIVSAFQGAAMSWAHDEQYEVGRHLEEAARFIVRAIAHDGEGAA